MDKFEESKNIELLQLKYLFLGLSIFIGTTILVNVVIRAIIHSDIYYRIGNYSGIFFILFVGAAITRYHLFGIEVILTEILVGLIGILLLVQIFIAPNNFWKVANGIAFSYFVLEVGF